MEERVRNIPEPGLEGTMVSQEFRSQLEGYGLTTANILYRRPDHPWLLQTYVWQDYDLCPNFPVLNKFLNFWLEKLGGPAALGHGRACAADQARRDPRRRRRVPAELEVGTQRSDLRWRLPFRTSDLRHQLKTPTIAPNKHVVSVPETIDFKPSDTTSSRFCGHMVESPAIMMPSEPKLAKPHIA